MTTNAQWTAIRKRVFKEQEGKCWVCPNVHATHETMHGHHAVYTYDKHFSKWLDRAENIFLLCPECHANHGDLSSYFKRCCAWTDKISAGYDMEKWHNEIPMLIKDNFLYLKKKDVVDK